MAGALTALPYRRVHGAVTWAASGVVVAGLVSLLGYLWKRGRDRYRSILPPVAFNTAFPWRCSAPESCCPRGKRL